MVTLQQLVNQKVRYPHVGYVVNNRLDPIESRSTFPSLLGCTYPQGNTAVAEIIGVFHQLCATCGF